MLEVTGLAIAYPQQSELFCDVSFSLSSGQVLLLQGPNGSGKTSLLYVLVNVIPQLIEADRSGQVILDGKLLNDIPVNQLLPRISLSLANPNWEFFFNTPAEEIIYLLENLSVPANELHVRLEHALALFRLEPWRDFPTRQLSLGWQRLVSLCLQAAANPQVLLLDEPFNGLSDQTSAWVLEWLHDYTAHGGTLILADHTGRSAGLATQILDMSKLEA